MLVGSYFNATPAGVRCLVGNKSTSSLSPTYPHGAEEGHEDSTSMNEQFTFISDNVCDTTSEQLSTHYRGEFLRTLGCGTGISVCVVHVRQPQ